MTKRESPLQKLMHQAATPSDRGRPEISPARTPARPGAHNRTSKRRSDRVDRRSLTILLDKHVYDEIATIAKTHERPITRIVSRVLTRLLEERTPENDPFAV